MWHKIYGNYPGWICQDAYRKWHDLLVKAGVKLVISGHTHHHAWFPAREGRPYGQLIGGGPSPEAATAMVVKANAREIGFVVKNLAGNPLLQGSVPA